VGQPVERGILPAALTDNPIPPASAATPSPPRPRRPPLAAMITKDSIIAKDLCTYAIRILRQEKILRDHGHDTAPASDHSGRRAY
jgi:hypothetical protein